MSVTSFSSSSSAGSEAAKRKSSVRLQRVVVHEAHFSDPEHENHLYHEHVEVSSEELFYDLVFVSAVIELANFLKQEISAARLGVAFLLFTTLWLTWFHTNMMLTRFHLPRLWKIMLFIVMLGSLGIGVHAVDDPNPSVQKAESGFHVHIVGLFLSIFLTRFALCFSYCLICWQVPLARPMISKYVFFFIITTLLSIICASVNSTKTALIIWSLACVLELVMYPVGLLTPKVYRMTVNMEHALERTQLWVILVLGESVIALVSSSHSGDFGASYYFTTILGFLIIFALLKIHIRSQLEYDVTADEHALEDSAAWAVLFDISQLMITAGMVGLAVGLKLAVIHSGDNYYKREYALMFTGSLGFTLVWMNISRVCHKFADYELFGTRWGRHIVWAIHALLSVIIIPIGFSVRPITKPEEQPVEPPVLMCIVAVIVLLQFWLESFLKALDDPEEEGMDVKHAHMLSIGTQTLALLGSDSEDKEFVELEGVIVYPSSNGYGDDTISFRHDTVTSRRHGSVAGTTYAEPAPLSNTSSQRSLLAGSQRGSVSSGTMAGAATAVEDGGLRSRPSVSTGTGTDQGGVTRHRLGSAGGVVLQPDLGSSSTDPAPGSHTVQVLPSAAVLDDQEEV